MSIESSRKKRNKTSAEIERELVASLAPERQQEWAESRLDQMCSEIQMAMMQFEYITGLVVDSVELSREVAYCGFPQPIANASACSVEEYTRTEEYAKVMERRAEAWAGRILTLRHAIVPPGR